MPKQFNNHITRFLLALAVIFSLSLPVQSQSLYNTIKILEGAYKVHQALTITDEDLADYMRESMKIEDSQHKVCGANSKYTIRLNKITKGLKSINGIKLNFKVYYITDEANAFASPDGSVRVYSKLMDIMTDDEILGVIGHEIGHVAGHHSKKEIRAALLASAARDGLMTSDSAIGDLAASTFGDVAEYMINAKYSRDQESEADLYGYKYLKVTGHNPYIMAKALMKLKELEGDGGGTYSRYVATLFSSHPDINNRIEVIKAKAKREGFSTK